MKTLRIATRKSELAQCQAREVAQLLQEQRAADPDREPLQISFQTFSTEGDRLSAAGASRSYIHREGGKALFVRELERAVLAGEADCAVHSLKDLPSVLPQELEIVAIPERTEVRDAALVSAGNSLSALHAGARVGVAGLRRQSQLQAAFAHLQWVALSGNVLTRLRKLEAGECDALVLAAAGLQRLGEDFRICEYLPLHDFLPAAGQGALALEVRKNTPWRSFLATINHPLSASRARAERSLCRELNAHCGTPLGALADQLEPGKLRLRAMLGGTEGQRPLRIEEHGDCDAPEALGQKGARALLRLGADKYLADLHAAQEKSESF